MSAASLIKTCAEQHERLSILGLARSFRLLFADLPYDGRDRDAHDELQHQLDQEPKADSMEAAYTHHPPKMHRKKAHCKRGHHNSIWA